MNADEYAKHALKTWTTQWSAPQQVAHAAGTLVTEWWEVEHLLDAFVPCDQDELADELGDLLYGVVILQHLVDDPYFSSASRATRCNVDYRVKQAQDLAIKYWRSEALDFYDANDLTNDLATTARLLGDVVCGFIRSHGFDPHELAESNARKLAQRHEVK
jgi:NTP pyrophosphatase (non-canonical NTP hydrolase)